MMDLINTKHPPQIDKLLRHPLVQAYADKIKGNIVSEVVRQKIAGYRTLSNNDLPFPPIDQIAKDIACDLEMLLQPRIRRVVNATGVILSTNLGRAPLPPQVLSNLCDIGCHYSNLELDLETGERGERTTYIENLLCLLTGCEASLVVNNNAAAVLLAVNSLANKKDVIVSRGELVEIGGSFRLPEVIEAAGGVLCEVGTTNKTRISDYEKAIGQNAGILLKCHRSNFTISGFTEESSLEDMVALAHKSALPFVEDLGSGVLTSLPSHLHANEPTVAATIGSGVDVVTFSGDKLLGGVQAGFAVGKQAAIGKMRANPLYRALRPDKLLLAVSEAVLALYLSPHPETLLPTLGMLDESKEKIEARAKEFAGNAQKQLRQIELSVIDSSSCAGGGTLPELSLASCGLAIDSRLSAEKIATRLRSAPVPVISIVQDNQVILDFRTIRDEDLMVLLEALKFADNF